MATTGADKLFVDTNVLIHATIPAASLHQAARRFLEENYQAGTEIWISRQILREFLATLLQRCKQTVSLICSPRMSLTSPVTLS